MNGCGFASIPQKKSGCETPIFELQLCKTTIFSRSAPIPPDIGLRRPWNPGRSYHHILFRLAAFQPPPNALIRAALAKPVLAYQQRGLLVGKGRGLGRYHGGVRRGSRRVFIQSNACRLARQAHRVVLRLRLPRQHLKV